MKLEWAFRPMCVKSLKRLRQEDCGEFETSLHGIARHYLKREKKIRNGERLLLRYVATCPSKSNARPDTSVSMKIQTHATAVL